MARNFCSTTDCEIIYEGFSDTVGNLVDSIIEEASNWVYANISEFHPAPSTALPSTGTSPNYWVRTATANEAIYLALNRRMVTVNEEAEEGYWTVYHTDALNILSDIYEGKHRIDPDPMLAQKGIGVAEAISNGTYSVGTSNWLESNVNVPTDFYEDDTYSRVYYIQIESLGATLKTSTFKWWTDMTDLTADGYDGEGIYMDYRFVGLSYGVKVRFMGDNFDSFEEGMTWKIPCYPERDTKQRQNSISTMFWERG